MEYGIIRDPQVSAKKIYEDPLRHPQYCDRENRRDPLQSQKLPASKHLLPNGTDRKGSFVALVEVRVA